MTVRAIICGSSHRKRGAGGWTDETWLDGVLRVLQPDLVGHGASPSGGGDVVAEACGVRHYRERGLDPDEHVRRFPMEPAIDGEGGVAFMRRNARMGEQLQPTVGIALVVGRVGQAVGTRGSYLSNGTQNMVDWLRRHRVPLVIRREDETEPYSSVKAARSQIGRLAEVTGDTSLAPVWHALDALLVAPSMREEALAALAYAADGRWAPWLEGVAATVRRGADR